MRTRLPILLWLLLQVALMLGCATTNDSNSNVSSIPWNRPQSWEGTGGLGAFNPPGSGR